ncbi:uncharacterized protein LOC110048987 isoform X2 [Orbicella faveolata]|uniref:uncharacterized protein LOC110048987 isoform X2 n=1 Tax=Orbicella faveolata TaxID=48498 RepID=UPI0009E1B7DF|nr:uncharacterized protein LOC110048987 isoform X2 [Orbicella faveolata]
MSRNLVDKVIRLCETRGFSVESRVESSLGTTCTYQFGPLGTELRRNLRHAWWFDVVRSKGNVYGFETTSELIIQAPYETSTTSERTAARLSENASTLTQFFRVIPGINLPFGAAWNRKYFRKPESDNYILSLNEEQMDLEPGVNHQTTIQYTFPWGKESVDSMTVSSDLHKYMTDEDCSGLPFNKESMPYVIQIKTDINTGNINLHVAI